MKISKSIVYVAAVTFAVALLVKLVGGGPMAVAIVVLGLPAISFCLAAISYTSPWISNHVHAEDIDR